MQDYPDALARCQQQLNTMFVKIDSRQLEQAADCFTEDGFVVRAGVRADGRAAIQALLADRPPEISTRHYSTNFTFRLDAPDEASAGCYVLLYRGQPSENQDMQWTAAALVEYNVGFHKQDNDWLISGVEANRLGAL